MINEIEKESIKTYFKNRKDIAFAFLFGSQAKGFANKLSDVDIAVYFYPKERHLIEFETDKYYDTENDIWANLQKILKKEVELIILNRASANISASAIRGEPLTINDWGIYIDFMEIITDVAEDYKNFVISDYKERSKFGKRD